jgi:hypothetical protein
LSQVETGRLAVNAGDELHVFIGLGVLVSCFFNDLIKSHTGGPIMEAVRNLSALAQDEPTSQESLRLYYFRAVTRPWAKASAIARLWEARLTPRHSQ